MPSARHFANILLIRRLNDFRYRNNATTSRSRPASINLPHLCNRRRNALISIANDGTKLLQSRRLTCHRGIIVSPSRRELIDTSATTTQPRARRWLGVPDYYRADQGLMSSEIFSTLWFRASKLKKFSATWPRRGTGRRAVLACCAAVRAKREAGTEVKYTRYYFNDMIHFVVLYAQINAMIKLFMASRNHQPDK